MKNNIRFDLSDYLIHFFRDVNLETGSHIYLPEHCGFNNQHHACFIDAKYLLRLSLRSHKIFSSWSYRNGQRTVYGDSPVVCFTDMPIAAYLETGVRRLERNEKIGLYAIVLPKEQMFNYGARPVIYGLDQHNNARCSQGRNGERILDETALPLIEQYRYVTYVPGKIDWTHEREWRWPYRGD
ncbi:cytoplasmic protein, partial [Salmonella enterica]|nr:cytoplasmic protein [Salmonella enterica]EBM8910682.1 cytoplasmic protein [Salmonella enterica subsp. enterica serovar Kentucky]ECD5740348.1 cytoplasmic protein [Salmonella enterica subsp. enterica serovar Newport]EDX7560366.1 cytoplasmic protein [Salmonella enterica subsp. enterica serovar 4,[5],12:i:-]EFU0894450.1 cytoplasmic protein [Salmonella enterica subsp. enterica serovar Hadar]EJR2567204.1 cytoplasmic protein [Salmonella enterica subsp. enterica serovar Typhimurium]